MCTKWIKKFLILLSKFFKKKSIIKDSGIKAFFNFYLNLFYFYIFNII